MLHGVHASMGAQRFIPHDSQLMVLLVRRAVSVFYTHFTEESPFVPVGDTPFWYHIPNLTASVAEEVPLMHPDKLLLEVVFTLVVLADPNTPLYAFYGRGVGKGSV